MIAVQRKSFSLAGLSVDISCNSSVMDNKFPSFSYVVKRDTTVAGFATSTLVTSTRTREGEFLESIKKGSAYRSDHQQENQCYSPSVAAKSATGICTPNTLRATQTPKASFFVSGHRAPIFSGHSRNVSMVALAGRLSSLPVSFVSGISTPANVTAISERGNSGGDSLNTKEAAAMLATTPTQNPQFIWLIAAVRRDMPTITAKIHHIAAETEQEARRILARDHVCFFAGRIRTGGAHA